MVYNVGGEVLMSHLINNDPDSVSMRKYQGLLVALGLSTAAFAVWSILKTIMEVSLGSFIEEINEMMGDIETEGKIFVLVFTTVYVVTDLILRGIISYFSIKTGKGKSDKISYLIPAFILLSFSLSSFTIYFCTLLTDQFMSLVSLLDCFVELTSMVILIELITVSIKYKKLMNRMKAKVGKNAD